MMMRSRLSLSLSRSESINSPLRFLYSSRTFENWWPSSSSTCLPKCNDDDAATLCAEWPTFWRDFLSNTDVCVFETPISGITRWTCVTNMCDLIRGHSDFQSVYKKTRKEILFFFLCSFCFIGSRFHVALFTVAQEKWPLPVVREKSNRKRIDKERKRSQTVWICGRRGRYSSRTAMWDVSSDHHQRLLSTNQFAK